MVQGQLGQKLKTLYKKITKVKEVWGCGSSERAAA
jgi:hypothetical protein